jgi:hypothetical protein
MLLQSTERLAAKAGRNLRAYWFLTPILLDQLVKGLFDQWVN